MTVGRPPITLARRTVLAGLGLPILVGCAAPIPEPTAPATTGAARDLLDASAAAHGAAAFTAVRDVSVSYAGRFRGIVGRLQPVLVDEGHRGRSEERLLLADRIVAQAHAGPEGAKQVVRQGARGAQGTVRVWFDGQESRDTDQRAAAALVADGYALFLLGPMLLAGSWMADRAPVMERLAAETIEQDGRTYACERLRAALIPGVGLSGGDQIVLYIDSATLLMRRVRFTLNGLDGTRGAVAEVDTMDHVPYQGVQWPTRFHEHLLRPVPLPVHDWRLVGLDLNRGLTSTMVNGPAFTGAAVASAKAWTAG